LRVAHRPGGRSTWMMKGLGAVSAPTFLPRSVSDEAIHVAPAFRIARFGSQ
jgi:hypothetical protein